MYIHITSDLINTCKARTTPALSHPVEHCQECVESVEVGLDGVLPVHLQLQAAAKELEDHHEELVAAAHILHMGQPAHKEEETCL